MLIVGVVHSGETSTSQHFFDGNIMLSPNSKNTTEASMVEGVIFLLMHSLQGSRLTAIQ